LGNDGGIIRDNLGSGTPIHQKGEKEKGKEKRRKRKKKKKRKKKDMILICRFTIHEGKNICAKSPLKS